MALDADASRARVGAGERETAGTADTTEAAEIAGIAGATGATEAHTGRRSGPDPDPDGRSGSDRRAPWRYRLHGPRPMQAVVLVVLLCLCSGFVGWWTAQPASPPGDSSVDVGFLTDMTVHHQQALTMSFDYLTRGSDPLLLTIAREIVRYQAAEIGIMNEWLEEWNREGDQKIVMRWMDQPLPVDSMPGLATNAQLAELQASHGAQADGLFSRLMILHHAGGIHMAAYAAVHAREAKVRTLASRMVEGQAGEISEMNQERRRRGLEPVIPPPGLLAGSGISGSAG